MRPDENNATINTEVNTNAVTGWYTWTGNQLNDYNTRPRTAFDRYIEEVNNRINEHYTWYNDPYNDVQEIKRDIRQIMDRLCALEMSLYWIQDKLKEIEIWQWFTYIQPDNGNDR
jgi:fructose-1,6-bisphosphatase